MGTSLSSIHIYCNIPPADSDFHFQSFSSGWQTCTDDFSQKSPDYTFTAAKLISKQTSAPVLHFGVFDSEEIWFNIFCNGKVVSRYFDDEFVSNKKLFDIPLLIGYADGQKKRLSSILRCADADFKIAMLEEYLGVCLLYLPELSANPEMLYRKRCDTLYQKYLEEEKALTGKTAPISLELIAEYPGKLFWDSFGSIESSSVKPHCFLYGYVNANSRRLSPVHFTGSSLEPMDLDDFRTERVQRAYDIDQRFIMDYGTPCKVTFSNECPPAFRGKTLPLPAGLYPMDFTQSGELLIQKKNCICVIDDSLKIIAKLSIKGDMADIVDNYILTTTGDSFCGYCYDPKAKIYIYQIVRTPKE